jgi:hypothetical protein
MDRREGQKLDALAAAVGEGHLSFYLDDPAAQLALEGARLDGALSAPEGNDLLSVVVNSRSGSKVDFYVRRTVRYDVTLGGTTEAFATTDVALRNDAPSERLPGYVNEPFDRYDTGDAVSITTLSCPGECPLISATRDGDDLPLRVGSELGLPWYQDFAVTPAGEETVWSVVTKRVGVWQGNSSGGIYRLTVLPQTTPRPTEFVVTIHAPAGTSVTWTNRPMEVDGGTATWRGTPSSVTDLVVSFRAPLPLRWWRNAVRLLP